MTTKITNGFFLCIAVTGVLIGTTSLIRHTAKATSASPAQSERPAPRQPDAAHGEYLVRYVADCAGCHSQCDATGNFLPDLWLLGGPLMFTPKVEVPGWTDVALPIAGLPSFTSDEDAITFLMTGRRVDGSTARPPMPPYRFNRQDAEDVVAYLRSLRPAGQ